MSMLFLSGIFYPIQALPQAVQYLFYVNPLTYTVDIFRYIMIGEHAFPLLISSTILTIFGIISIILGTYLFDRNLRK